MGGGLTIYIYIYTYNIIYTIHIYIHIEEPGFPSLVWLVSQGCKGRPMFFANSRFLDPPFL